MTQETQVKVSEQRSAISRIAHGFGLGLLLSATIALLAAAPAPASGPPQIGPTYAVAVAATSATLGAEVSANGEATTYAFQYVTQERFEQTGFSEPFSTPEGSLGSGTEPVTVTAHLGGLAPHTSYRYRLLASNAASPSGGTAGSTAAFTTQLLAAPFALPDQRAWELVSPPDKHGGTIEIFEGVADIQAAADGEGVSYVASSPLTETAQTGGNEDLVVSSRTATGWSSREIMPSKSIPEGEGAEAASLGVASGVTSVGLLSSDLSKALIEPSRYVKPLSPEATERTLYVYDAETASYLPLVTPANVPAGTAFGGACNLLEMHFLDATPDLSHVVFHSIEALTPEAHANTSFGCEDIATAPVNLYEWAGGALKDVGILPNGEAVAYAYLGQEERNSDHLVQHAISNDGRWIVWSTDFGSNNPPTLYLRDMTKPTSVRVSGSGVFQGMTPDASRVFYLEKGELHSFDPTTETDTIATAHMALVGPRAQVQAVIGSSEDGKSVYLVAKEVLGGEQENAAHERAVSGQPNLYLLRESGGAWTPTYIATLSPADEHSWIGIGGPFLEDEPRLMTSHLSPDGRWLAFMSQRPLTGYDNTDAVSGQRDEEVFLYDGASAKLICASCNPTGARPHGLFDINSSQNGPLVDPGSAWGGRWLAGSMPGWRRPSDSGPSDYQPRELGDSGRLFFQSADALVPQDTNGVEDVYEYEPVGVGSCAESSPTFSSASGGCVSLISSGSSAEESVFYDASESGNDVYFSTTSQLAPQDVDRETDVYDARSPHLPGEPVGFPLPQRPPACEGDACQPPVEAPNDQTPGSLTYHGPGNEHPLSHKRHGKHHRKKHHKRSHRRVATHKRGGGK
jgi:hypothetical protein